PLRLCPEQRVCGRREGSCGEWSSLKEGLGSHFDGQPRVNHLSAGLTGWEAGSMVFSPPPLAQHTHSHTTNPHTPTHTPHTHTHTHTHLASALPREEEAELVHFEHTAGLEHKGVLRNKHRKEC